MKKKIAILGSTGSIGVSSLNVIEKNLKKFQIILLSANSNYNLILKQIYKYKPKFFIINDTNTYFKIIKKFKKKYTKIYNNYFKVPPKIKFDITISGIVGIAGLEPTIEFTKKSKKILLANKESIICGWHLIKKVSLKNKTEVLPLDSEHFSIYQLTKNFKNEDINKIYITASGGPFLNKPLNFFKNISPNQASKHPNWKMGKKISIDSSNLMNKVLEIIEAQKFFPFDIKKYEILIHPKSLIHAIVFFNNGQTKFLYHETDMRIPIANAIYDNKININRLIKNKNNFLNNLDHLKFEKVNKKKFPIVTLLEKNYFNNSGSIILNASNEVLVESFIKKKITFNSIYQCLKQLFKDRDFRKYAIKKTPDIEEIYRIDEWARNKTLDIINK